MMLKDRLGVLKKMLQALDTVVAGMKGESTQAQTPSSASKGKEKQSWQEKCADTLDIPVSLIESGINERQAEYVLEFIESHMFLPAFKRWRYIASEISLAKRMIVFHRKLDLIFTCLPLALKMDKNDIFSLDPNGPEWKEIATYTTYTVSHD